MGWSDPDMTPARDAAGAHLAVDPRGEGPHPTRRRRRRGVIPLILGVVLMVVGAPLIVLGAVGTADAFDTVHSEATPRGMLSARGDGLAAPITVAPEQAGTHTVYLLTRGLGLDSDATDRLVAAVTCVATLPNERTVTMAGARQGVSADLNGAVTVGSFTAPAGRVTVACRYPAGAPPATAAVIPFAVAAGSPSDAIGPILMVVGGILAAVAGLVLLILGIVRLSLSRP